MSTSNGPALRTPTSIKAGHTPSDSATEKNSAARKQFAVAALNMGWQLAVVVLVPIIGGVELDKKLGTAPVYLLVGLGVATVGSVAVMWQAMQAANRLPVPKLTAEQKRKIQKSYEEEDEE